MKDKIRGVAQTFALWATVFVGVAAVVAAYWSRPMIARQAARPVEDPALRYTSEQLGPSPQAVIDAVGRKGYPSPPDVLESE